MAKWQKVFLGWKLGWGIFMLLLVSLFAGLWFQADLGPRLGAAWFQKSLWLSAFAGLFLVWAVLALAFKIFQRPIVFKAEMTNFLLGFSIVLICLGVLLSYSLGVFGELRMSEGGNNKDLWLQDLQLKVQREDWTNPRTVVFERSMSVRNSSDLTALTDRLASGLKIERYIGLAEVEESGAEADEKGMKGSLPPESPVAPPPAQKTDSTVRVMDQNSGRIVAELGKAQLNQPIKAGEVTVTLKKILLHANVGNGGLTDGGPDAPENVAAEIVIEKQGQTFREVVFERYPTFSLLPGQDIGVRFLFAQSPSGPGQSFSTIDPGVMENPVRHVKEVMNARGSALPPSAVLLKPTSGDGTPGVWVFEGERVIAEYGGHRYQIEYGPVSIELPFLVDPRAHPLGESFSEGGYQLRLVAKMMADETKSYYVFSVVKDPGFYLKWLGAFLGFLAALTLLRRKEAR